MEAETGIAPLHILLLYRFGSDSGYIADDGTAPERSRFFPSFALTASLRTSRRSEFALTAGLSWSHYRTVRYDSFGFDPDGKPRFDLRSASPGGWRDSSLYPTLTLRYRFVYNPDAKVNLYSGVGLGLLLGPLVPGEPSFVTGVPELTPLAVRFGGEHFYGFVEMGFSPVSSLLGAGVGWHF